jgi:uncharacterized membrane protein YtjA (UPF0391 family)
MLHWALIFFVIALIAALRGFHEVAGLSAQVGKVFALLAVVFLWIYLFFAPLRSSSLLFGRVPAVPERAAGAPGPG